MIRILDPSSGSDSSFWSLLGRSVFSLYGNFAGRITGLYFSDQAITAIQILYGLRRIKISSSYIENMENLNREASLLLKIEPSYLLIGRNVYDSAGRKLGQVRNVIRTEANDEIQALVVRKGRFGKGMRLEMNDIETMKKNIILRTSFEEARDHV